MRTTDEALQKQVQYLSRKLRTLSMIFGVMLIIQGIFIFVQTGEADETTIENADKILKVRGLVIVDEAGRKRILVGAPASKDLVFENEPKSGESWEDILPPDLKVY